MRNLACYGGGLGYPGSDADSPGLDRLTLPLGALDLRLATHRR